MCENACWKRFMSEFVVFSPLFNICSFFFVCSKLSPNPPSVHGLELRIKSALPQEMYVLVVEKRSGRSTALLPTFIRWWQGSRALEESRWQERHRVGWTPLTGGMEEQSALCGRHCSSGFSNVIAADGVSVADIPLTHFVSHVGIAQDLTTVQVQNVKER